MLTVAHDARPSNAIPHVRHFICEPGGDWAKCFCKDSSEENCILHLLQKKGAAACGLGACSTRVMVHVWSAVCVLGGRTRAGIRIPVWLQARPRSWRVWGWQGQQRVLAEGGVAPTKIYPPTMLW